MASPSSTSASRRGGAGRPRARAGLLALAAVVAVDRAALGPCAPWTELRERVPKERVLERGIAQDHLELIRVRRARRAGAAEPLLVVVGSSRAHAGFRRAAVPPAAASRFLIAELAHAQLGPFEARTLAPTLVRHRPALVVLMLSEFETHGTLRIVPEATYGDAASVVELARGAGPAFVWEHRLAFQRLGAAVLSNAYRYRDILGAAGLDAWRRFPGAPGLHAGWPGSAFATLAGNPRAFLTKAEFRKRVEAIRRTGIRASRAQIDQLRSITRGDHARIQMDLAARAIGLLRAGGSEVLIVELPVAPQGERLYDGSIREDFRAFAARMQAEQGARFLPLESTGPFREGDFGDLTHLDAGGARLTEAVLRAADEALASRSGAASGPAAEPGAQHQQRDPAEQRRGRLGQ